MWGAIRLLNKPNLWFVVSFCLLMISCNDDLEFPLNKLNSDSSSIRANAGVDIVASINETVLLDAKDSNGGNSPINVYEWKIESKPAISLSEIVSANSAKAYLSADVEGVYIIQLTVINSENKRDTDLLRIVFVNELPIPKIIEESLPKGETYVVGDEIRLNGLGSRDPDNSPLSYRWQFTSMPKLSASLIQDKNKAAMSFIADVSGSYVINLTVSDGVKHDDTVYIVDVAKKNRQNNTRPYAKAGEDQVIYERNTSITLNASASFDPENDLLSYRWRFVLKPQNSTAFISDPIDSQPTFVADLLGDYVLELIVSDAIGESHADTVVVTPHSDTNMVCRNCHERPSSHALKYDDCQLCHRRENWLPANQGFHAHGHSVKPTRCQVCHNGIDASGKSDTHRQHIITEKDCNFCHASSLSQWRPVSNLPIEPKFNHDGVISGCVDCHNNKTESGKPLGHMNSSDRCAACHITKYWSSSQHLEHSGVFANCENCHNGLIASGKPFGHPITNAQMCGDCHTKSSWLAPSYLFEEFDHKDIISGCIGCHNNSDGQAKWKSTFHLNTSNRCEACHYTNGSFSPGHIDHVETLGMCVDCHNNFIARGKSKVHLPTTDNCSACHNTQAFVPIFRVDHNEIINIKPCVVCHNNQLVLGKPANHLNTTNECSACHAPTARFNLVIKVSHDHKLSPCSDCHQQYGTHAPTTDNCAACHSNDRYTPTMGKFVHMEADAACHVCHITNLPNLPRLPEGHQVITEGCWACHGRNLPPETSLPLSHPTDFVGCDDAGCHSTEQWAELVPFHHQQQTSNCASCHESGVGTRKPNAHMATSNACESCHQTDYWKNMLSIDHLEVRGECIDCHEGETAKGKNLLHITSNEDCGDCHSTDSFKPAKQFVHTFPIEKCITCHNGLIAVGKSKTHFSTSNECGSCHSTINFVPAIVIDHTQIIGFCSLCHNGIIASGKSSTHILSNDKCEDCHPKSNLGWTLTNEGHYRIDLLCEGCHLAPDNHRLLNVNDKCTSCHIVATWESTARPLSQL